MTHVWNWNTKNEDGYSSEDTSVYPGVEPIMVPVRVSLHKTYTWLNGIPI